MLKSLNSSLEKLVAILNDGQYHDGTTLGQQLGMTRSAVWKAIKKLANYGIHIDGIKGKGYALLEPLCLLNKKMIQSALQQQNVKLQVFETLPSTNAYLKSCIPPDKHIIQGCFAEQQTCGKGRLQREWYSPFGQNIYFSCAYPFSKDISELAGLSLIVALAVAKTLETYGLPQGLKVKWPNDVFYADKKISGNLIEIEAESHGNCHAVIGIGINVNMLQNDQVPITQPWTSLRNITGYYIDRNSLSITLINYLLQDLHIFAEQGLAPFLEEWQAVDGLFNKNITLQCGSQKTTGQVRGIDSVGRLILWVNHQQLCFSSGDATIVK